MECSFSEIVSNHYKNLSRGKQKVIDYIIKNIEKASFCSASELAASTNVSNAQIVKLYKSLGYSSFKEMQSAITRECEAKIRISNEFESWLKNSDEKSDTIDINYLKIIDADIENIKSSFSDINIEQMAELAKKIAKARRVAFVGSRGVAGCNVIPSIFLNEIRDNVFNITPNLNNSKDILKWWGEEDVVIGASFYYYKKGFVFDMLKMAHSKKCTVIIITDIKTLNLCNFDYCDNKFCLNVKSLFISFVPLITFYNVLIYFVTKQYEKEALSDVVASENLLASTD